MIRLVVAFTSDLVIAKNGQLPFYLSDDLKHFKQITQDRVVVMGRKTFESIGKPLPGRRNVVLSRQAEPIEGAYVMSSLEDVFKFFGDDFDVIGGAEIYKEFLLAEVVDEAIITHIHDTVGEGVIVRFPIDDMTRFVAVETLMTHDKDEKNDAPFTIQRYTRLTPDETK